MTNPIYYNRVVTSTVQGDGYGVIEPNGTLVVANGGELRLHDGSTAGGNEITGSGGGIPLTGATYDLNSGADLVINTTSGAINLLNNAVAGVEISDVVRIYSNNIYSEMRSNGNFAIPGTLENANATTGNVTINTNDGTTSRTWTFGQDGSLSVPQSPSGAGQITGGSNGIQLIANSHAWGFGTDASLSLPGTATGASGVLNLSDDSNVSITAGSTYGFFIATNGGGNGQPQWGFGTDASLTVPGIINLPNSGEIGNTLGYGTEIKNTDTYVGFVKLNWNDQTAVRVEATGVTIQSTYNSTTSNWVFGSDGTGGHIQFPDFTVQNTAFELQGVSQSIWGTTYPVTSGTANMDYQFFFDGTTGYPMIQSYATAGGNPIYNTIWSYDAWLAASSSPNPTAGSSGSTPVAVNNTGGSVILSSVLQPGDYVTVRIQCIDTGRIFRATFMGSVNPNDFGITYGSITVERLL